MTPGGQSSELLLEKEETRRDDCKLMAPETSLVRNLQNACLNKKSIECYYNIAVIDCHIIDISTILRIKYF